MLLTQVGSESQALRTQVSGMERQIAQAQQAAESTQVPYVLRPASGTLTYVNFQDILG